MPISRKELKILDSFALYFHIRLSPERQQQTFEIGSTVKTISCLMDRRDLESKKYFQISTHSGIQSNQKVYPIVK
jgi:hypothetical protein